MPVTSQDDLDALRHVEELLVANSEMLDTIVGTIRDEVVGYSEAAGKTLAKVRRKAVSTVDGIYNVQNQGVGRLVQDLGAFTGQAIQQNADAVNQVMVSAALGGNPTNAAPAVAGGRPQQLDNVRLYATCRDHNGLPQPFFSRQQADGSWTQPPEGQGYVLTGHQYAIDPADRSMGQMMSTDYHNWVNANCFAFLPPPPVDRVLGGPLLPPGNIPPGPAGGQGGPNPIVFPPQPLPPPQGSPPQAICPAGTEPWWIYGLCPPVPQNTAQFLIFPISHWSGTNAVTGQTNLQLAISRGYRYIGYVCAGGLDEGGIAATKAEPLITAWLRTVCQQPPPAGFPPPPNGPPNPLQPPPLSLPTPVPVACVVQPPLPQFKGLDCKDIDIPDILTIGSPSFCAAKDSIRKDFVVLGNTIIGVVNDLGLDNLIVGTDKPDESFLTSPVSASIHAIWENIQDWLLKDYKVAWDHITGTIKCWYMAMKTSKSCNITEVLSLSIARALIELLQKFRIGWDIAIWGTLDITVRIDPLVKVLDYLIADACPAEIPSAGEAIEAYIGNRISEDLAKCWLSLRGCNWDVWYPIIQARMEKITAEEFIQWGRRVGLDEQAIQDGLRLWGFVTHKNREAKMLVYDELPTISDVLHFLQRNVFDTQYVADYGLMDGFSDRFWPRYGPGLRAIGVTQQVAEDHYAAHWINPSIGQLAEMMQRLRPGRVDPTIQFTVNDFNRVLQEQDVAPYFRKRMEYVAYRTLPLRQMNAATQQGRFDRQELSERWQDIGFRKADADVMADTSLVQAARQIATTAHGFTPALISGLAEYGLIDQPTANLHLGPQGFTPQQVKELFTVAGLKRQLSETKRHDEKSLNDYASLALKAYADGAVDAATAGTALFNAGYSQQAADLELTTVDLRVQMETVDAAAKVIRKAFMLGEVDVPGALNALAIAGVVQPMAATYVSRWQLEMSVPRVAASTAVILRWARKGIISVANAASRLANLGWNPTDLALQVVELQQEISQAQANAAAKNARQLAIAQRQAQAAFRATQSQFCKIYTPTRLVKWYALRIIDDTTFKQRLQLCGRTATEIDALFKEAEVAREAKDRKAAKTGPVGVEYTGQGAATS